MKISIIKYFPKTFYFLIFFGLILLRCINEPSPLSDIPVSDPSVVTVYANLIHVTSSSSLQDSMRVELKDKNDNFFSLLIGGCFINDIEMHLLEDDHTPYYYLTNKEINVFPCSTYTFTIMLADSATYSSTLIAPPIMNFQIHIPSGFIWGQGLPVSWHTLNNNVSNNEAIIHAHKFDIALDSSILLVGEFLIQGKYFLELPKPDTISVDLQFERRGIAPAGFNGFQYVGNVTFRASHIFK